MIRPLGAILLGLAYALALGIQKRGGDPMDTVLIVEDSRPMQRTL